MLGRNTAGIFTAFGKVQSNVFTFNNEFDVAPLL